MEMFPSSNLPMATTITGKLSAVDSTTETLGQVDKLSISILKKDNSQDLMHRMLTSVKNVSTSQPLTSEADKATMVSSDLIYSPEKCRLRQRIEFMKKEHAKKIKSLRQHLRRSTNQSPH